MESSSNEDRRRRRGTRHRRHRSSSESEEGLIDRRGRSRKCNSFLILNNMQILGTTLTMTLNQRNQVNDTRKTNTKNENAIVMKKTNHEVDMKVIGKSEIFSLFKNHLLHSQITQNEIHFPEWISIDRSIQTRGVIFTYLPRRGPRSYLIKADHQGSDGPR